MKEEVIQIFIDCIKNYFLQFGNEEVEFGTPYLSKPDDIKEIILEYTGAISISGDYRGALYISSGRDLLEELTELILDVKSALENDIIDIAGEITNTIAGNARQTLGQNFLISVPLIITGKFISIETPKLKIPTYIIPFSWRNKKSYLCIGLETNT
ncbi:MAG: chemotaxis protein CheX [Spirochaetia bacterium]|nr:chemotaxis protein CheX [Spirochaetia bacterium]